MKIHIQDGDLHLTRLRTRMPFKYGIATMTSTPHAFLRLRVEGDGKSGIGIAADSLPPKWFTKDPARALDEEVADMLRVIEHALDCARGLHAESPFDAWRQLYDLQARWGHDQKLPALLSHFGTALVERALIDAVCRLAKQPFFQLVRSNEIGMRLDELHPSLAGKSPADFLPEQPLRQITLRQTVGLADPLLDEDVATQERLDDGLPQSLAACIRSYGLHHFKIKVSGRIDHDRERLRRIAPSCRGFLRHAIRHWIDREGEGRSRCVPACALSACSRRRSKASRRFSILSHIPPRYRQGHGVSPGRGSVRD